MELVTERASSRKSFTLVEMMVVIAIIGLIAAIVVPQIVSRMDEARVKTTRLQIRELENAVNMFKIDNGFYPTSLEDLVRQPANAKRWPRGGYLKEIPKDAWGNEFVYVYPGGHGAFDIISYGEDGRPGGEEEKADIANYPTESQ